MNLEWKSPPPAKRGPTATKWVDIAEQLRAKPNTWAMVAVVRHASQGSIISKTYSLKVVTRKVADEQYEVYAMHEEEKA